MSDVLVVDDDPAIVEMVSEALAMEGIAHRTAPHWTDGRRCRLWRSSGPG